MALKVEADRRKLVFESLVRTKLTVHFKRFEKRHVVTQDPLYRTHVPALVLRAISKASPSA
ncbi:MAG: hypothetical protein AUI93_01320 [Crenarchaeota archaeon 13_1_40CM_3_52_10]|nr:MAG: hypothetical protein AUI93_01320 [Crenarchaeota archaeon 13_1_40CM_3_52_10]OLE68411.1 MAG: hypothetical protein AUF78_16225 [archaeon 13_1_20CM_2_51_12]